MDYETFKKEYLRNFKAMCSYTCEQVGSGHFAEKLADLCDVYPEFEENLYNEEA